MKFNELVFCNIWKLIDVEVVVNGFISHECE